MVILACHPVLLAWGVSFHVVRDPELATESLVQCLEIIKIRVHCESYG